MNWVGYEPLAHYLPKSCSWWELLHIFVFYHLHYPLPPFPLVGSSYGSTRAFVPFEQQSGRAEIGFNLALSRSLAQDVPVMVRAPTDAQLVHLQVKRLVRRIRSQVPGWRRLWKLVTILVRPELL